MGLVGILEVCKAILGAWQAILGGVWGHLGLAGGHLADLGGWLVATMASKSQNIDFPMDVDRFFAAGYALQLISEDYL